MRGASYLIRRIVFAISTIFVAITLNFLLFRVLPGNAVNVSAVRNPTPELQHTLERRFGLDKPKWDQYVIYLKRLAHADLGVSFEDQRPVSNNIFELLKNTLPMVGLGVIAAMILGVLSGVLSAWRRGTAIDHANSNLSLALYAAPTQWLGLMLLIIFAGILPVGGMQNDFLVNPTFFQHMRDLAAHIALPSLALGLNLYGGYALITRSAMLETLGEDYVLTARARGMTPWRIVRTEALRNALLPTVTLIGLSFGYLVGGAILIETVFSWPGIGRATFEAVINRDYPMLQGTFLVLTLSVVFFNLLADLLYLKLDPRISE